MNIAKLKLTGSPLSPANIQRTTEIGRELREKREALRRALDNQSPPLSNGGDFYFTNESFSECLAIGPTFRFRIAA